MSGDVTLAEYEIHVDRTHPLGGTLDKDGTYRIVITDSGTVVSVVRTPEPATDPYEMEAE